MVVVMVVDVRGGATFAQVPRRPKAMRSAHQCARSLCVSQKNVARQETVVPGGGIGEPAGAGAPPGVGKAPAASAAPGGGAVTIFMLASSSNVDRRLAPLL